MIYYQWNYEKNLKLKQERGISFEQVVMHIEHDEVLDIIRHPNVEKYPHQKVLIIRIEGYVYAVPFVQDGNKRFLKTIIPSRKLTKKYLGVTDEEHKT